MLSYALLSCKLLVGGIFLLSTAGKIRDPRAFAESLPPFGVPRRWQHVVAIGIVAAESGVVLLLAWSTSAPFGFVLAAVLLIGFTLAIVRVLRTRIPVKCRCFGAESAVLRPAHVWRNVVLAVVALAGLCLAVVGPQDALDLAGVAVIVLLVATVLTLEATMDTLVKLTALMRTAGEGE